MHRIVRLGGRIRALPICAVATAMLSFSPVSQATISYVDLSLEQLLQIRVSSASKKMENLADAAVAIYAITAADIEMSGVTTIPDALRMVPGVEVARSDSNSWAISIRGFNSVLANKLLVLVDGRTIYNPVFGGVLWEAHDLMLENIERIEVIRGPGGSLWGANAVNGVINITTKHSRDTQGNLISAIYGNEEEGTLSGRHGGTLGESATYRVYAKGFKQDAALKAQVGAASLQHDNYDEWNGFRTGFRVDWQNQFTLQGNAFRTNAQQLRPYYSYITPQALNLQQTIVYEGVNVSGRWKKESRSGSHLTLQAYVDWAKRDEPFNFVDDRTTFDVELQYDFAPSTQHEIIMGAGFRLLSFDKTGNENVSFDPSNNTDNIYNAFVQDKITLVPGSWYVTLGTKIEYSDYSNWEHQPSIRLQWQNDKQTWWTSYSRAARTPTPIEKNLTSTIGAAPNVRVAFVPNEDFEAEELTAFEVGYRHQLTPKFSLDITSFYNEYDKLTTFKVLAPTIVNNNFEPVHTLIPVIFTNDMVGDTHGAELAMGWEATKNLHIMADYSYLDMSLTALAPTQESAERLSPRHQFGTRFFWDSLTNWSLGATAKYTDKLPATNIDGYLRLDLNLGLTLNESLKMNLIGQNLLESSNREFGAIDDINVAEIERSIFAKFTLTF